MSITRKKICLVVTAESAVLSFLLGQLRELVHRYDVTLLVNTDNPGFLASRGVHVRVVQLRLERKIHPWRDIRALLFLILLFRRERFDMVQSLMPKAGLLAMLAGWITRIPVRSHIFTGQVWVTRTGFTRWLLKSLDRLLATCATNLLTDSISQRTFLIAQGVTSAVKLKVLAKGSICGVDTQRFLPDRNRRQKIRNELGLSDSDLIFLYLGRLNREKGLLDLAEAFKRIADLFPSTYLLLVGPDEENIKRRVQTICANYSERLRFVGYTDTPEYFMAAADVFCLPSHREGFGSVIIEAAACGIPAIGASIYGVTDAIENDQSGLLFKARDIDALSDCMCKLVGDEDLRKRMGYFARERAIRDFSSERVTQAWLEYYDALL